MTRRASDEEHGPETKPAGAGDPSGARPVAVEVPDQADVFRVELQELGASMPWAARPDDLSDVKTVDLLLYALDSDGRMDPDPAAKVLGHATQWLEVLQIAVEACPEVGIVERLGDLSRMFVVAGELHRRQRAALLDALAALR